MFVILREWFSQGFSLPVIVTDAVMLAFGLIGSLKIRRDRTVLISMLILIGVYILSVLLSVCGLLMIETYAKYLGAFVAISFAGAAVGLLIRTIKNRA